MKKHIFLLCVLLWLPCFCDDNRTFPQNETIPIIHNDLSNEIMNQQPAENEQSQLSSDNQAATDHQSSTALFENQSVDNHLTVNDQIPSNGDGRNENRRPIMSTRKWRRDPGARAAYLKGEEEFKRYRAQSRPSSGRDASVTNPNSYPKSNIRYQNPQGRGYQNSQMGYQDQQPKSQSQNQQMQYQDQQQRPQSQYPQVQYQDQQQRSQSQNQQMRYQDQQPRSQSQYPQVQYQGQQGRYQPNN